MHPVGQGISESGGPLQATFARQGAKSIPLSQSFLTGFELRPEHSSHNFDSSSFETTTVATNSVQNDAFQLYTDQKQFQNIGLLPILSLEYAANILYYYSTVVFTKFLQAVVGNPKTNDCLKVFEQIFFFDKFLKHWAFWNYPTWAHIYFNLENTAQFDITKKQKQCIITQKSLKRCFPKTWFLFLVL